MTADVVDFTNLWTLLLGLGVVLYVLLDGFDLGVGMIFGLAPHADWRTTIMNSIAPVWDGNETWLVLGGLALFAAFPLAFAIIIPAVYFPLTLMLLGLVFRGVAFEYRLRGTGRMRFWDYGFCLGSAVAAFAQGVVLGAFIQGFEVEGRAFAGGTFDCFTPFSVMTGLALMAGYGLLGAGWLIIKTENALQDWSRNIARRCLLGSAAGLALVSLWTPLAHPAIAERWFAWPDMLALAPLPAGAACSVLFCWRSLRNRSEHGPFISAVLLFLFAYLGVAASLWPMIAPPQISLSEAAASPSTQAFLLVGALFLLPIIGVYTAWSYWVFRGKVRGDIGYH